MRSPIAILLILFSLGINAQNWKPISLGNNYNYQFDTTSYITNVIFIDSAEVISSDSVFYLNRIVTDCDTCPAPSGSITSYALKNQPQFLMRRMIRKTDSLYLFQDTIDFWIRPLANLGEIWLYDSVNSVQASISSVSIQSIFGISDSVKTISLSNGKTIVISKNFGIIRFEADSNKYYNLIGIEGSINYGEVLPNFSDFLDYELGDILQLYDKYEVVGLGGYLDVKISKVNIISKTINGNSVTYEIDGMINRVVRTWDGSQFQFDTTMYPIDSTLIFTDSLLHLTNRYPNEMISIDKHIPYDPYNYPANKLNWINIFKENGLYVKQSGCKSCDKQTYIQDTLVPDLLVDYISYYEGYHEIRYTAGLGRSYRKRFSYTKNDNYIMGRVHSGDTIGEVYSDSFFETIDVNLGLDIIMTENQTVIISGGNQLPNYLWSTGDTIPAIVIEGANIGVGEHNYWLYSEASNGYSDSDTIKITVTENINVDEINLGNKIEIYPNPTTGLITIKNEKLRIMSVEVFDIYGKEVVKSEVGSAALSLSKGHKTEVDLSTQPKGIYIIKVQTSRGVAVEKVILE